MYNTIIICPAGDSAMKICPYCMALICPYNNRKHRCKKCKSKKHTSFETRYVDIPYKPARLPLESPIHIPFTPVQLPATKLRGLPFDLYKAVTSIDSLYVISNLSPKFKLSYENHENNPSRFK